MKKYIFSLFSALVLLASCQKDGAGLLDKTESGDLTEKDIFSDGNRARQYLTNAYRRLPKGFIRFSMGYLGSATDEGQRGPTSQSHELWFNNGTWTAENIKDMAPMQLWNHWYMAIRVANKFMENVDLVPVNEQTSTTEESKERMKYEARFLRAMYYSQLFKMYGGAPIITKQLDTSSPELMTPRAEIDDLVKFITDELDAIIEADVLPADYRTVGMATEYGRATSMAAYALKARVLTYAARPLFNDPANSNRLVSGAYDANKWNKAAQAGHDAILHGEANGYKLHVKDSDLSKSYEDFFITRENSEIILSFMRVKNREPEFRQVPYRFTNNTANPAGVNLPLLNLVEAYEMKDGTPFDPTRYNEPGFDPFANRDQRFYSSVFYNGAQYKAGQANAQTIEIWMGEPGSGVADGRDHDPTSNYTGFYLRKFIDETVKPGVNTSTAWHNFPIMRYAEVLLNYAEAMNEAYGPEVDQFGDGKTAKWAVDQVRQRALQPVLPAGLDQTEMKKRIINERRVELAWEEHRFWDVRMWKMPETQREAWALDIYKDAEGNYRYVRRKIADRVFLAPQMYLFPVPIQEVLNGKYPQNPGW